MERLIINPARVDFVTLRLFCSVAQSGSITKGASQCHLALSAASRRLADFEATVGVSLLERTTQGVQLTAAGHVAMQHAVRLCHGFEVFGAELSDYSRGYRGHVRLWANMSALIERLPEVLASFMGQHPEIKVDVEEQLSGDIVRALIEGMADIGVLADGTPTHGLTVVPFHTDELVVICPDDHVLANKDEVSFSECLQYPVVGLNRGSSLLELISSKAQEAGGSLQLRVQVRSFGALCRMVGARLGVGVLPRATCEPLLDAYRLKALRLTDSWAHRRMMVACSETKELSSAGKLLWEQLIAHADRVSTLP
ncbi:LysR family transcriptional regulator [Pandoraea eparura]|uniref:LysR family transcriptional regulator n=1 Tax=Pandoraea eparura TaxID=2508291 RepID=UPI00123EEFDF|nr:LysR family transcriptional regulator [Pandoraea eparura]